MPSNLKLAIFLCDLISMLTYSDTILASMPEINHNSNGITNQTNFTKILNDNSKLLPGNYATDLINEIIYHNYPLVQNSNSTENGYSQDLAVLTDIICSNELHESIVKV